MFYNVRLHLTDSLRELLAFGLKLKRKHGKNFLLQPCPAFQESQCCIYLHRPERCRLFECRQLQQVASGEISETVARDKIEEVVRRVAHVNQLLHEAGKTDPKKPLTKRYEKITAEPVDLSSEQKTIELRSQLTRAMQQLETLLEKDFRPLVDH